MSLCCAVGPCRLSIPCIRAPSLIPTLPLHSLSCSSPSPLATTHMFPTSAGLFLFVDKLICVTFQISHVSDILWYLPFCLTSLSGIMSSCFRVAANGLISFSSMAEQYSTGYMWHIFFIHSSAVGRSGCFHVFREQSWDLNPLTVESQQLKLNASQMMSGPAASILQTRNRTTESKLLIQN